MWSFVEDVAVDVHEEEEAAEKYGTNESSFQTSEIDPTYYGQSSEVRVTPSIV